MGRNLGDAFLGGIVNSASAAIGSAAGVAIGAAVTKVVDQELENYSEEQKLNNQKKRMNLMEEHERKKMALEEEKKAQDLPTNCPHCGAPTNKKLVCEYCECKVKE